MTLLFVPCSYPVLSTRGGYGCPFATLLLPYCAGGYLLLALVADIRKTEYLNLITNKNDNARNKNNINRKRRRCAGEKGGMNVNWQEQSDRKRVFETSATHRSVSGADMGRHTAGAFSLSEMRSALTAEQRTPPDSSLVGRRDKSPIILPISLSLEQDNYTSSSRDRSTRVVRGEYLGGALDDEVQRHSSYQEKRVDQQNAITSSEHDDSDEDINDIFANALAYQQTEHPQRRLIDGGAFRVERNSQRWDGQASDGSLTPQDSTKPTSSSKEQLYGIGIMERERTISEGWNTSTKTKSSEPGLSYEYSSENTIKSMERRLQSERHDFERALRLESSKNQRIPDRTNTSTGHNSSDSRYSSERKSNMESLSSSRYPNDRCSIPMQDTSIRTNSVSKLSRKELEGRLGSLKNSRSGPSRRSSGGERSKSRSPKRTPVNERSNSRHQLSPSRPVQMAPRQMKDHIVMERQQRQQPQQQQQQVRDPGLGLLVEIGPGVWMKLRGADETWESVGNGDYGPTVCLSCSLSLLCVNDAEYVLCPECRVVGPITDDPFGVREELLKTCRAHGVGLGFTPLDVTRWQAELSNS
jgi:hypothetical protein